MRGVGRRFGPAIRRLVPNLGPVSYTERLRASLGAMVGLMLTGFVSRLALGAGGDLPLLIAPMGASAVLLFAVPASPLAQPWSIVGGNTIAALIGITCGKVVADPVAAAAIACACAIGAMLMLRCLHPPSGAVALTAVLGGPAVHQAGYAFAVWPVGLNSLLLLAAALLFNNVTGRRYPHAVPSSNTVGGATPSAAGVTRRDVATALRRHDEVIDIDRDDLVALVHNAERAAQDRLPRTAADLMTAAGPTVLPQDGLEAALASLGEAQGRPLWVTDAEGRLVGVLSLATVFRHLRQTRAGRNAARLFQRSIRFDLVPRAVADIMEPVATAVGPDAPFEAVAARMIGQSLQAVPVVAEGGVLLGLIDAASVMAASRRDEPQPQPRSVIQRL